MRSSGRDWSRRSRKLSRLEPGRIRVLVATPDFPPERGGIQTLIGEVVRRLENFDRTVVTLNSAGAAAFDAGSGMPTVRVPRRSGSHKASVAVLNARTLELGMRLRPSVILSGHVVTAPAAITLQRAIGARVVLYTHANEFESRPRLSSRAVRDANAVIAVSRYTRQLVEDAGGDPRSIHLIHPGVARPDFPIHARDARPTLLTVARLTERNKGHDVVLRALPRVLERVPDLRWVVLGGGPLQPGLEALAREVGVAGCVDFLGAVTDAARDEWFDRAHAFVLVSRPRPSGGGGEGFGIVYLEAAAHGLPVVAANVGGALDAVDDGRTGLLVDPTDADAVADAVCALLTDRARAQEMGRAGAVRAREFTWEAAAAQVATVLGAAK